jgi:hypothetical protein
VSPGARHKNYRRFLQKATPGNVGGLAIAHAHALEAIAQLALDLERIGCRCNVKVRSQMAGKPLPHVDICPMTLRQHKAFQVFNHTATDEPSADAPPAESVSAGVADPS